MSLLRRLFGRAEPAPPVAVGESGTEDERTFGFSVGVLHAPLVQVAGTTTFCRELASKLAEGLLPNDGYLECPVTIEKCPEDDTRPEAIDVQHETGQIGALPSSATRLLNLDFNQPVRVPAQLFAAETPEGPRLDAWVWLGQGPPEWKYSRQHRPPVTTFDRAAERHWAIQALVREGLADDDPHRQRQFGRGLVDGVHYLEAVEPIKELKREGRLTEALAICYLAIQGAEQDCAGSDREPAPWYTIQAAIIHRKLRQRPEEIAVLRRWLDNCPPDRQQTSDVWRRWTELSRKDLPDQWT